jgi:hypothetical protein
LNKYYYYPKSSQRKKNNIKTLKEIMVFKILLTMSNTSIKYLIQAIIIIISITIPLTLDSSSLLTTTTTTTALAFHVDSAGNPTMRQSDIGTGGGGANTTGGGGANTTGGGGANTTVATVALNYINETRKAIQVGNSTAALTNLDLAERQLSLLIGSINSSIVGGGNVPAAISIPANQTAATLSSNISSSTVIEEDEEEDEEEEPRREYCNDHLDNNNDGQIDEGCTTVVP